MRWNVAAGPKVPEDRREDARRLAEAVRDPAELLGSIREEPRFNTDFRSTPDGAVAYRHLGPVTEEVWRNTLRPLIARLGGGAE